MNIEPLYLVNSDVYVTNNVSQARQDETQNPIYAQNALQEGDSVEFSANYNSSDTNSLREDFEKTKDALIEESKKRDLLAESENIGDLKKYLMEINNIKVNFKIHHKK